MSLLSIAHLTVAYGGVPAVSDVSLTVDPGEIVALIGESGSGKSSLALAIGGLSPEGASIGGVIRRDGAVGFVFQDPQVALNPALTIGYQIGEAFPGRRRERASAVTAAMAEAGLDVPPGRYPHQLSGGQRQRAAIAMALIGSPCLLIADEPTAALDPTSRGRIAAPLAGAARARGMGLLLITHDLALAATWADRIALLDRGRLVEEIAADALDEAVSPELRRQVAAARMPPAPAMTGDARPALVTLHDVTRRHGRVVAVAGVSLEVKAGETLGIVGESGAGKTSLARIVLGLDRPDAGAVSVGGLAPAEVRGAARRALHRRVQAVFQDPAASFDPRYTVGRIVAEPLHLLDPKPTKAARANLIRDALAAVELGPDLIGRRSNALSGGQQQRVALARALVVRPELVVLDEALSALDARLRGEMIALLRGLQREQGVAYLLIGHDFGVMRAMADRLVVLRDGRVIETGATADMLDHPRDPYTAALIAASPTLDQALAARAAS